MVKTCSALNCKVRDTVESRKKGISFHRFPQNRRMKELWAAALKRKNWKPRDWSHLCSNHFREEDIDRTSLAIVRLREGVVPTVFTPSTSQVVAVPKKKLRTSLKRSTKELDESLFWDFIEDAVLTEDGRLVKKVSQGCATIEALWNPLEIQKSQQSNNGMSENSVKFRVQVNIPGENELMDLENNMDKLSPSKLGPHAQLRKELTSATGMVDQLKTCVRRLKLENLKLQSEHESTLIRNLHNIKKDATEGDLNAIILLNKIVLYPAECS